MSGVALLNESLLSVMLGLGEQTGLLDRLAHAPATRSDDLARATALDERRVRHWLGAMVAGGVLDYDGARERYQLATTPARQFRAGAAAAAARRAPRLIAVAPDRVVVGAAVLDAGPLALIAAFHVLADEPAPAALLARLRAALAPGGTLICLEAALASSIADNVEHPLAPALYAHAALTGAALWGEDDVRRMLADAGFADVEVAQIDGDGLGRTYVARTDR